MHGQKNIKPLIVCLCLLFKSLLFPFPFSFIPLFLIHLYSSIHSSKAGLLLIHLDFPRHNSVCRTPCMSPRNSPLTFRTTLTIPSSKFYRTKKCSQLNPAIRTLSLFSPGQVEWKKKSVQLLY